MDFTLALEHLTQHKRPQLVLKSFIRAYDILSSSQEGNEYVAFKFRARAKGGVNYCKLSLDGSDDYRIELGQIRGMEYEPKFVTDGLDWSQLKERFEEDTGLYLSLV